MSKQTDTLAFTSFRLSDGRQLYASHREMYGLDAVARDEANGIHVIPRPYRNIDMVVYGVMLPGEAMPTTGRGALTSGDAKYLEGAAERPLVSIENLNHGQKVQDIDALHIVDITVSDAVTHPDFGTVFPFAALMNAPVWLTWFCPGTIFPYAAVGWENTPLRLMNIFLNRRFCLACMKAETPFILPDENWRREADLGLLDRLPENIILKH